jgi:hypothetical protein
MNGWHKRTIFLILLIFCGSVHAQNTLMLEKVGTHRHFFFHPNDPMKIRLYSPDTVLKGNLWALKDSSFDILGKRPYTASLSGVHFVYRKSRHVKYVGIKLAEIGMIYSCILAINHLINNEQVFTNDMWIVPASFFVASGITLSFYQRRYGIGLRWKLKVLNLPVGK